MSVFSFISGVVAVILPYGCWRLFKRLLGLFHSNLAQWGTILQNMAPSANSQVHVRSVFHLYLARWWPLAIWRPALIPSCRLGLLPSVAILQDGRLHGARSLESSTTPYGGPAPRKLSYFLPNITATLR